MAAIQKHDAKHINSSHRSRTSASFGGVYQNRYGGNNGGGVNEFRHALPKQSFARSERSHQTQLSFARNASSQLKNAPFANTQTPIDPQTYHMEDEAVYRPKHVPSQYLHTSKQEYEASPHVLALGKILPPDDVPCIFESKYEPEKYPKTTNVWEEKSRHDTLESFLDTQTNANASESPEFSWTNISEKIEALTGNHAPQKNQKSQYKRSQQREHVLKQDSGFSGLVPLLKTQKYQKNQDRPEKPSSYNQHSKRSENFRQAQQSAQSSFLFRFWKHRYVPAFAYSSIFIMFIIGSASFAGSGLKLKGEVLGASTDAVSSLENAIEKIAKQDFKASSMEFSEANAFFGDSSKKLNEWGGLLTKLDWNIPFFSQVTSAKYALDAGGDLTLAAEEINKVLSILSRFENPLNSKSKISLLEMYTSILDHLKVTRTALLRADESLDKVSLAHLPEDKRDTFLLLKNTLPEVTESLNTFIGHSSGVVDFLGGNGPRKYLFLFQNNQELRPTGGFIGSYGLLDISGGHIREFFIDGIFNPDGQLKVDVIPPRPIQKISAGWSLHDSNWFANFPTSAEKAIYFYEKTGGATVDGVITLTPTVLERLLTVIGSIALPEYDTVVDSDNFIQTIQYEVEVDYDKEENRPKKILADLAPIMMEQLFSERDPKKMVEITDVLFGGLREKQILLYSRNEQMQALYQSLGFAGELRETDHDFLEVVHTNINGYKTDGVVDEQVELVSNIQDDGRIINTLTVAREHTGGDTNYEWWNKVNSDYMRVYVPLGSKLLSAEGHTREYNENPLDYESLDFIVDPDIKKQEDSFSMDPESGTHLFTEDGKTVFGNWVYVSPKESVVVTYTYELPFRIDVEQLKKEAHAYSLFLQKQPGTIGSSYDVAFRFPKGWHVEWMTPEALHIEQGEITNSYTLKTDTFYGFVLSDG